MLYLYFVSASFLYLHFSLSLSLSLSLSPSLSPDRVESTHFESERARLDNILVESERRHLVQEVFGATAIESEVFGATTI